MAFAYTQVSSRLLGSSPFKTHLFDICRKQKVLPQSLLQAVELVNGEARLVRVPPSDVERTIGIDWLSHCVSAARSMAKCAHDKGEEDAQQKVRAHGWQDEN